MTTKPCNGCGKPIVLLGSPFTGKYRPFDPIPVNGRTYVGPAAYPREALNTYRFPDLVERLMVRRQCSSTTAEEEAYDMDWYVLHTCPREDT